MSADSELRFYGDSFHPWLGDNMVLLEREGTFTVCDYSECGMYVGGGLLEQHMAENKGQFRLAEILRMFPDRLGVWATNNGFAVFFNRYNVKTVGELRETLKALKHVKKY